MWSPQQLDHACMPRRRRNTRVDQRLARNTCHTNEKCSVIILDHDKAPKFPLRGLHAKA